MFGRITSWPSVTLVMAAVIELPCVKMTFTPSPVSFWAAVAAVAGCSWLSSYWISSIRPLTPPAALISATPRSSPPFAISP